ncbi:hypothetical protein D9M68_672750 [compost metagenome]
MVITDMERRLGRILEARIAKGLPAEVVARAHFARIVAEQVDVVAVVRLVGGAGHHRQGRQPVARPHLVEAPFAPQAELAKHQHLGGVHRRTAAPVHARQGLDEIGQLDLGVDPQRHEEDPVVVATMGRDPAQVVGPGRVVRQVVAEELLLLVQQLFQGNALLLEEGLQAFHLHRWRVLDLREVSQRQGRAQCVGGPGQGRGWQAGKAQAEGERQVLHRSLHDRFEQGPAG